MELIKIQMTCSACPSQWDAWDAEGQRYYIRYRFGNLTVDKVPADIDNSSILDWKEIFQKDVGDKWDGCMSTTEMLDHTQLKLVEGA